MAESDRLASGRVLVVEDDPALRNVVRFNLQRAGIEVIAASNPYEAWTQLQRQSIDLILTDMNMPLMSGLEFCRQIRASGSYAQLPLVMLTAKGLEIDAEQLRKELGVLEVVFKPFSPRQLTRSVSRYLCDARAKTEEGLP